MLKIERISKIHEYLIKNRSATVKKIAKDLDRSETMIRRDLAEMEKTGLIRREYGYVVLLEEINYLSDFSLRMSDDSDAKRTIAEKAIKKIERGDVIFLDESTTTFYLARKLTSAFDLTVITNSLAITERLAQAGIKTFCAGGFINGRTRSFTGDATIAALTGIYANKCFISSSGINDKGIICDKYEKNLAIKKIMLKNSEKKFYLCDGTKIGINFPYAIAGVKDFDEIITDGAQLPENYY